MRVAFLWTRMSGYLNACLKELASRSEVELLVVHETADGDAPFDDSQFAWIPQRMTYESRPDRSLVLDGVQRFEPQAIFVSSWHIGDFRFVLRRFRRRATRVLCMDNQWKGSFKQWLGVGGSRWYLRGLYDAVFVPGERQACFAQRLGFSSGEIWHGLLCPDVAAIPKHGTYPHVFGFIGRLSKEKGVLELLEAYDLYRRTTSDPWTLNMAGAGPLEAEVTRHPSVDYAGFVQPEAVNGWLASIGCLVVPSKFEPWGVAISEAAAAGLPIIATEVCGAVPHLVHDFANGRIARPGDPASIAKCLEFLAHNDDSGLSAMGQVSLGLSAPYTPKRWADTVLEIAGRWPLRNSAP
jgi:glycosyltransferase involved in cell wall biosynthesis